MVHRIAAVSFLNTVPLLEGLAGQAGVSLELGLPSALAGRLATGKADAALVPVAEILSGRTGPILCPAGIACDGAVDSVMLFCCGDPAGLKRVRVDRGSRSSVALLRILLAELYGIRPEFEPCEPRPGMVPARQEGLLIIGDRCFGQLAALGAPGNPRVQAHDLGAMWRELTGLPFVFAAWAAAPSDVCRLDEAQLRALGGLLTAARDRGLRRLEGIATEQAARGRLGRGGEATAEAIVYYYRQSLRFVLDDRCRRGVEKFRTLALAHEALPATAGPVWLDQGAAHAE